MFPLPQPGVDLPSLLRDLAESVRRAGGRAWVVGGAVRDQILGQPLKDADVEVFGLPAERIAELLQNRYEASAVGKSFGVFKLKHLPIDVSLPRREQKIGPGHQGFAVEGDPFLSFAEAATRRDFTINAMGWDPLTNELADPHGGRRDLHERRLRHVSDHFAEDPLRVLRGMQFCARFLLEADPATVAMCRTLSPAELSAERLFEEWKKLLLHGVKPSHGLRFLKDCHWLPHFPELAALDGCQQDPEWHPEGDVWIHTLHCLDAFAAERTGDPWEDLIIGFAVLCHDLGKPLTTFVDGEGRIRSPGHETAGVEVTRIFLQPLTRQVDLLEAIVPLVAHHMRPSQLYASQPGDGPIRRLAKSAGRIDRLVRVVRADMQGSPPRQRDLAACDWLLQRAEALAVKEAAPLPLLQGRHLVAAGLTPGPHFKAILQAAYEAQLEGLVADERGALEFLQKHLIR